MDPVRSTGCAYQQPLNENGFSYNLSNTTCLTDEHFTLSSSLSLPSPPLSLFLRFAPSHSSSILRSLSLFISFHSPSFSLHVSLSAGVPVDGEGRIGGEEGGVLDEVLGELYIFLMKESNMMLNIAYTNTVIER